MIELDPKSAATIAPTPAIAIKLSLVVMSVVIGALPSIATRKHMTATPPRMDRLTVAIENTAIMRRVHSLVASASPLPDCTCGA